MPDLDAGEIIALVQKQEDNTSTLRDRMERDYDIATLAPFDAGEGYASYTSNNPASLLDKLISWMTSAVMIPQFTYGAAQKPERKVMDAAERFLVGCLRSNDERLALMLESPLREQLASFICMRGWGACRALLVKDKYGQTYVDVTPWDPLHTYWGPPTRQGVTWACYKTVRTGDEVDAEWGLTMNEKRKEEEVDVYDYYDQEHHAVIVDREFVVEPELHGARRTPVVIMPVGPAPLINRRNVSSRRDGMAEWGESIYKNNRDIYDSFNFVMSSMKELVNRSRKPPYKVRSRDGSVTLEKNPLKDGGETAVAEDQDIEPIQLAEMTRDTMAYLQVMSGELQRGGLPFVVFGDQVNQISGYNTKLLQLAAITSLVPRITTMQRMYVQIAGLLFDQYQSGDYQPMELSGMLNNRKWFSDMIFPEQLRNVGIPEIRFRPELPQDDEGKMAMAAMAREGNNPMLPDRHIYGELLDIQDVDTLITQIREQQAERMLPTAALWTLLKAAMESGNEDTAQFYFIELQKLMSAPPMLGPGGGGNGGTPAKPELPGFRPEVLPRGAQVGRPPVPGMNTPGQAGANVPPGTPRPGA